MNKYYIKIGFTSLVLLISGLLISCGESSNLKDPNTAAPSSCKDLGGVCVNGRFIDDAVINLDYECDKIIATTKNDGSFSCPLNSKVTFLIKNPDDTSKDAKKITLGSVVVKSTANLSSGVPAFLYVTPATLAPDQVSQKNIVRLLHALSGDPTDPDLTGYIINISELSKKKLPSLSREILPIDFALPISTTLPTASPGSFDELMQPFLVAVGTPSMITGVDAAKYLKRGIDSTVAGVYADPFRIISTANLSGVDAVRGMVGSNSLKNMIASIWSVVDRKGRVMGAGVYSYENISSAQLLSTNPKPMELTALGVPGPALTPQWPHSGNLLGMTFNLMDANNSATTMKLGITQGLMEREALAGNDATYKILFDEPVAPPGALGRWEVKNNTSTEIDASTTQLTLVRSVPAAPSLDPDLWLLSPVSGGMTFPLHVDLTFFNQDNSLSGAGCDGTGCPIGQPIRVSILQDGNIISDIDADCAPVDTDTLVDSSGSTQELPLGLVQSIFKSGAKDVPADATFMTLAFILPNKPLVTSSSPGDSHEKYLRYAQLLTNFGQSMVMRVDSGPDYLKLHSFSSAIQNKTTIYTYNSATAEWANFLTFLKYTYSNKLDGSTPSTTTADYLKNWRGYVRSAPAACPP